MTFTVYYETGQLKDCTKKFHHIKCNTLHKAKIVAKQLSLDKQGSFISILCKGIDVATFYKGKRKS